MNEDDEKNQKVQKVSSPNKREDEGKCCRSKEEDQ